MIKRLIYLLSFVLVLNTAGNVSAELVLHLPFEDAQSPIDASANPATVRVLGSLNLIDGKIGKGLEFDGNNANRIEVTHAAKLEGMSALSIAAWVLPRNIASHEGMSIISKRNAYNDGDVYNLFIWTGQLVNGRINGNNTNIGLSMEPLEDNVWYHITLVFDGDGNAGEKIKLYINGVLESSDDHPASAVGTGGAPVWFGELDANRGFAWDGIMDEVRLYNHALSEVEILGAMEGKPWPYAFGPDPADGVLLSDTWVNTSWTPGALAVSHDVYIGDNFDAVNEGVEGTFIGNQATTFAVIGFPGFAFPDGLVPGTTYYWRIDEVNDAEPNSPWKGDIWSFSIPPKTAYFPSPADSVETVDVDVKLSWTGGFGSKLHTVYFGDNFDDVSNATGGQAQGTTTYTPGTLKMAKTYYWRVDEFDIIETHKGDVWSFITEGAASSPSPAKGAVDVTQTPVLTWVPGVFADTHEVYFGTDASSLENKGSGILGSESYDTGNLEWNTTYYWRVDEANNANTDSPWTGPLWSFTTANFLIIDDFESYNDLNEDEPGSSRIYLAWVDGFDNPAVNGSVVGHANPPFAEQTIVNSGNQSMPFAYDNAVGKSEATLTLSSNRDWTVNGVNTLTIWYRGASANAAEPMYVVLNGSAVVTNDNPDAAKAGSWTQWNIDLQAFADQGVNLANVTSITLGLGNRNNPVTGGSGMMYYDDIRLYAPVP
ncbi:MAG: LamG domain-containing protein [Planctomycetes bacterium]|nr:LamG domain-containing protein [Planctomycetota bacterium]MBL7144372.1 LamG domain-containing protein [Phycisphaerae bacterium]